MRKTPSADAAAPARIDARIAELGDWRGATLSRMRRLIHDAVPDVVEEWKWRGVPVWSRDGQICTGETYRNVVKLTFLRGASLPDPAGLFNASLDGNVRRAIDIREGEEVDAAAFRALVRAAAGAPSKRPSRSGAASSRAGKEARRRAGRPRGRYRVTDTGTCSWPPLRRPAPDRRRSP